MQRSIAGPHLPVFMSPHHHQLTVETTAPIQLLDVTDAVRDWLATTGVREGLLTLLSAHTTARVVINERDERLQADMVRFLEGLAPAEAPYAHNTATVDGRPNAHAHLLALLGSAGESIPVAQGALLLGAWQSIFLLELDGPRRARTVHLHLLAGDA